METIHTGRKTPAALLATVLPGLHARASSPSRFPLHRLLALILFLPITARSATQSWNPNGDGSGGNGTWDTGITANWDSGVTWTDSNNALFSGTGGTVNLVTPTANSLTFSAAAPYLLQSGTLTLSGSDITVNSDATIASVITASAGLFITGNSTLTLTGGSTLGSGNLNLDSGAVAIADGGFVTSGAGNIGYDPGSSGAVTVAGGGSTWTANSSNLYVGTSGTGTLTITAGGAVSNNNGWLGYNTGSSGTVTVSGSGSTWTNSIGLYVGESGSGTLSISNGGTVYTNYSGAEIGDQTGSTGTVTVDGTGSKWIMTGPIAGVDVGYLGTGTLNISNGGVVTDLDGFIGFGIYSGTMSNGSATVSGSGSTWTNGNLTIGNAGNGTLLISNGGTVYDSGFQAGVGLISNSAGSSGAVTVSGSGSTWTNASNTIVGGEGVGTLNVNSGGLVSDAMGWIGTYGTGTVTVTGTGSIWTNSEDVAVGELRTGTLLITGGGTVSTGTFGNFPSAIGDLPGTSGTATVTGYGSNWTIGGALYIGNRGTGALTITAGGAASDGTGGYPSVDAAAIGYNPDSSGTVTVSGSGSSWTNSGDIYIGNSGTGSLLISSGATVSDVDGWIGYNPNSSGMATVSGTGSTWTNEEGAGNLFIGGSGSGTLMITAGGAVSDGIGYIGYNAGSVGTATVSGPGSTWSSGILYVGYSGSGSLLISKGGAVSDEYIGNDATIGYEPGSSGSVTVTGSGSTWSSGDDIYVGESGTGTLLISSGGAVSDLNLGRIGNNAGSNGSVTVTGTGSTWTNGEGLIVGLSGVASLLISDGGAVSDNSIAFIAEGYGSGSVTVSGSGSTWTNTGFLSVGAYGTGTLLISSGGAVSSADSAIGGNLNGFGTSSTGTVTVSGSGSTWNSGALSVGEAGAGTLQIINVGTVTSSSSILGDQAGSVGTVTVSGPGSSWTNPGTLTIGNSGTGALLITGGASVVSSAGEIIIGDQAGSVGVVTVSGRGSLWYDSSFYAGGLYAGYSGVGTILISNGAALNDFNSKDYVGYMVGSRGVVTVSGSGSSWSDLSNYIGYSGAGTLSISGGAAVSVFTLAQVGYNPGSNGSVTVSASGSSLTSGLLYVGYSGNGSLVISNGGTVVSDEMSNNTAVIGYQASSDGSAMVTGSGSAWTSFEINVGESGTGSLLISAGAVVSDYTVADVGLYPGSSGRVTVTGSGSTWSTGQGLAIGVGGVGSLLISNGASVSDSSVGFIAESGGSGTVTVSGSGSTWTNGLDLYVGMYGYGTGTLVISNGGAVVSPVQSAIGGTYDGVHSTGTVIVGGRGSTWSSGELSVGEEGAGTLLVENGGAVSGTAAIIGDQTGSTGTVTVTGTGSQWTNGGSLIISNSGTGILTLTDGGLVTVSGTTTLGSRGTLQFDGSSTLNTGSLVINGGTLRTLSASTFTNSATLAGSGMTVDSHGFNSTFTGNFTGAGGIVKTGAGTLTLTGSSTLGGALLVSTGGGVQISGSGFLADATGSIGSTGTSSVAVIGNHSTWTNTQSLVAGNQGNGTLTIASGGAVSDASSILGDQPGSLGTATVSGTGSKWTTSGNLTVGYSGTGTLAITSGATATDASGFIGYNAGSNGSATVSGAGSKWTNTANLTIGNSGIGTLSITTGGLVNAAGITTIGSAGTLQLDGASTFDTGSLTIKGGTVKTLGALTFAPSATLGTGGATINTNGFNSTFSGALGGTGGLAKSGSGTLTLTGRSTYSGTTSVTAGTLALATGTGHTAALSNTAITVGSGATFAATLGASPVSKSVFAGTTGPGSSGATLDLAPGSAFTMAGSELATFGLLQQNAFSGPAFTIGGASGIAPILTFDIGNAASGTDLLHVTKTVDVLATGGKIDIAALAGDTTLTPGSYDLITSAGGFTGTGGNGFTLTDTTLNINGATYDFSLAHSTIDDEILTVTAAPSTPFAVDDPRAITALRPAGSPSIATAAVPEPDTTMCIISAFGIGWLLLRRRK